MIGTVLIWCTCHPLIALGINLAFYAAAVILRRLIPPLEEML